MVFYAGPVLIARTWRDARLLFVIFLGALILLGATVAGVFIHYGVLWARGLIGGAYVPYVEILRMRLRGVVPGLIVNNCIKSARAGRPLDWRPLVEQDLAGGNVRNVVSALIAAQDWDVPLTEEQARELDLAGYDVLTEVEQAREPVTVSYVNPETDGRGMRISDATGRQMELAVFIEYKHVPSRLLRDAGITEVMERVVGAVRREVRSRAVERDAELTRISQVVEAMNLDADSSCDILSVRLKERQIAVGQ
jgi:uncharacterized protein YqfA (UPF0365 family)